MADPQTATGKGQFPPQYLVTTNTASTQAIVTAPQTTPTAMFPAALAAVTGVLVQADPANSGTVEVGYGAFALGDGFSLAAGASRKFPVSDAAMLFSGAATAGQKLRILVE
ncbi:MAG: hypothetical protein NVS3B10_00240 [Polyangiales bacterium]